MFFYSSTWNLKLATGDNFKPIGMRFHISFILFRPNNASALKLQDFRDLTRDYGRPGKMRCWIWRQIQEKQMTYLESCNTKSSIFAKITYWLKSVECLKKVLYDWKKFPKKPKSLGRGWGGDELHTSRWWAVEN